MELCFSLVEDSFQFKDASVLKKGFDAGVIVFPERCIKCVAFSPFCHTLFERKSIIEDGILLAWIFVSRPEFVCDGKLILFIEWHNLVQ